MCGGRECTVSSDWERQKRFHRCRGAWTGSEAFDELSMAPRWKGSGCAQVTVSQLMWLEQRVQVGSPQWVIKMKRQAGARPWKNPLLQGRKAIWKKGSPDVSATITNTICQTFFFKKGIIWSFEYFMARSKQISSKVKWPLNILAYPQFRSRILWQQTSKD